MAAGRQRSEMWPWMSGTNGPGCRHKRPWMSGTNGPGCRHKRQLRSSRAYMGILCYGTAVTKYVPMVVPAVLCCMACAATDVPAGRVHMPCGCICMCPAGTAVPAEIAVPTCTAYAEMAVTCRAYAATTTCSKTLTPLRRSAMNSRAPYLYRP